MKLSSIQVFKLMYFALDEIWNKTHDDELGVYLSDANPLLCDEGSADPVVYSRFSLLFGSDRNLDDYGWTFVQEYLKQLDGYYGDVHGRFLTLSKEDYLLICEENMSLSDAELEEKYL